MRKNKKNKLSKKLNLKLTKSQKWGLSFHTNLNHYHWTIFDYFNVIKKMNLDIKSIDECAPCAEAKKEKLFYAKRKKFPIYLVFACGVIGEYK